MSYIGNMTDNTKTALRQIILKGEIEPEDKIQVQMELPDFFDNLTEKEAFEKVEQTYETHKPI